MLVTKDVKDTETQPTTSPDKSSTEGLKEFNQRHHVAFSIIYYNIEPQMRGILDGCSDPVIAWRSLCDYYQPKGIVQKMHCLRII